MCGIAGVAGGDPSREREFVSRMSEVQRHRGPDDGGIVALEGAVLANRRLSVIDPDAPGQPLSNEDGRLWITFNGEIYNHRELRPELEARGHRFRTRTDTEVLLHLFEDEGWGALDRVRGMFAFAIWDQREGRLYAARDPFGQKPFHYALAGGRFLFASEIKGILAHPAVGREPELEAVDHYLTQRFVPAPLTMFRGVRKLAAGHRLEWAGGEPGVERWWTPRFEPGVPRSDTEWIEGLAVAVERAVDRHLESDVEVGALLSGGLDSSAVVASMVRLAGGGQGVRTFCVGTEAATLDDRPWARMVAAHLGTDHREERVGDEILRSVPTLVRALDEPSDPIAACTWTAARLASREVKVALGGDGGDEVFGGFDRYAAFGLAERYASVPRWLREGVVARAAGRLPGALSYKSLGQKVRWLSDLEGRRGGALYARMTSVFRFGPAEKAWLYGGALRAAATGAAERCIQEAFDGAVVPGGGRADEAFHRMLLADLETRLPEHSLLLADRLSMAHGLELRSPLLDRDLWAYAASMPMHLKVRGRRTKVALREAFRPMLPAEVTERPKQGFMLPFGEWMQGSSLAAIRDRIEEGPLVREGWIASGGAGRLAGEHEARRADHHVRLWMLLTLDAWARIMLEDDGDEEAGAEPIGAGRGREGGR
jgi:asparagine synthase (glutamine-hydrolysing)